MPISDLLLRLIIAFITLLLLTRVMGRKEISQLTFFNFVSAITIGALTAVLIMDSNVSIFTGLLALVSWSVITIILAFIDIKFKKARIIIEGQPKILIKKGKIMEKELQKVQLDVDALNSLLRQKDVFSISEVDYAIFETNGNLSVMKKESNQPLTKSDAHIQQVSKAIFPITTSVISDGKVDQKNLEKLNLDKNWLIKQLQQAGIISMSEVFYAEIQRDGKLYIDKRKDHLH